MDSDTAFEPNSIHYLEETLMSDEKIAGVCGKLTLSNFGIHGDSFVNKLFHLTTQVIVGYQYYEYHYNQILGKRIFLSSCSF